MPLFHCNIFARTLGMPTNVQIFLPASAAAPGADFSEVYPAGQKFRTLYLLHGMNGDETSWLRKTNAERYAQKYETALVMPSVHNSFYTDTQVGLAFFTYLTEELPAMLRSTLPITEKREETFIAGLSMGGYGAAKAALARPDLYSAFGSFSGALDIESVAQKASSDGMLPVFQCVFGDPAALPGSQADLFALSAGLKPSGKPIPRAYLSCGTEDALCCDMNRRFHAHLTDIGFPHEYEESPGAHEWDFWEEQIQAFFAWLYA